mgnify:CR=1 FL=1
MYKILCDGKTLHNVRDPDYQVLTPKISLELNKTGNLEFWDDDNTSACE